MVQIEANARRNGLPIAVIGAAISKSSGWATFVDSDSQMGKLGEQGSRAVPTTTLDEWAAGRAAPALIKLDIEGAEAAALAGGRRLLETARPVIVCECHDTVGEVAGVLRAAGYAVSSVEAPGLPLEQAPGWTHLLAVPVSASG